MARLRIPSPSIPDLVFLALALGVPLALGQQLLNSDGDLGRHIRVGEYILGHGLLHRDIFSFTRLGNPFVGYEWLSEVLTALAYRYGGLPLVAACCGLIIGATYWVIARLLLREGVDPFLAYVTAMLAAIIGSVHWLARPHLFTLLGVALVMSLLERGRDRDGGSWGARVWAVHPPLRGVGEPARRVSLRAHRHRRLHRGRPGRGADYRRQGPVARPGPRRRQGPGRAPPLARCSPPMGSTCRSTSWAGSETST